MTEPIMQAGPTQVDYITGDAHGLITGGTGNVAQTLIANNMNPMALRTNATLLKDEWIELDTAIVNIARERLVVAGDLLERGLRMNVQNALGTLVVQHQTASEFTAAEVSMDGVTKTQGDRQTFNLVSTPLPVIHKDFQIQLRHLEASRRQGQSIDVSQAEEATRQVSETIEGMTLNGLTSGDTLGFGTSSAQLFGYTNRTSRNTVTLAQAWDASGKTGEEILDDVLAMITAAHNDRMFGPYMLYVPGDYYVALLDDFKAQSDKSILSRLLEIPSIIDIKAADKMTADNVVLVQMTRSNVDMVVGMEPTVVAWEGQGGMVLNFKVMSIMVPRIKLDAGSRSGIVHLS